MLELADALVRRSMGSQSLEWTRRRVPHRAICKNVAWNCSKSLLYLWLLRSLKS